MLLHWTTWSTHSTVALLRMRSTVFCLQSSLFLTFTWPDEWLGLTCRVWGGVEWMKTLRHCNSRGSTLQRALVQRRTQLKSASVSRLEEDAKLVLLWTLWRPAWSSSHWDIKSLGCAEWIFQVRFGFVKNRGFGSEKNVGSVFFVDKL